MKTHRAYFQRVAQVLAAVGIAFALLAAAPVAQGFRTIAEPRFQAIPLAQPAEGDVVARLSVPRLSLEAPIYEGIGSPTLARGAGHIPGTALPGEEGGKNHSVLALPRDSAAAAVAELRLGEIVTMRTPFGVRTYRVTERRVLSPEALNIAPTQSPQVTLVTPYPTDSLGPAPLRLALVLEKN
ncbi:MAG: class D sortase [Acidobacteriota bacterium]|nr:class D sortase [Acidobacteriota bacterium]